MEFDAFLAYNSADQDEVRRLHDRLQRQGLRVWRDETDLRPGDLDQDGLEAGILGAAAPWSASPAPASDPGSGRSCAPRWPSR